jgi:uncharacterized protein YjbI with pentapeptide repeats
MSSYSLDFDGSNDYVTVANIGTLSSLTVECWMYNTDSGNGSRYSQMVSRGANGISWDWAVYLIPGNTLRWVGPGGTTIDTNVIPLNTWTHIAVTCNNVQTKIYINGVLIRTQSTTNAMTNQTSSVMFGNDVSLTRPYKGRLSEIRIWNIIRSDSNISTSYTTTLIGNETGLIGYYKLNSTSGSTAVDTSTSARNGTLSNFTLSGATSNWVVGGPSLGITPTIGALATIPTKTVGTDVSFNLTDPSSNSTGAFTYSSSNTSVATVLSTRKVWTMTRTSSAQGNFNLKLTANNTDIALHIDFRSDRVLLAHYTNGAWSGPGPGFTAEVFDFHNLPLPTVFTVEFDTTNFKITYGPSNRVLTYPNSLNVASINGISDTVTFLSNVIGTVTVQTIQANATIVGPGTSIITATQAADASYNVGSVSTTLTVNAIPPTFGTFTLGPKSGTYLLADVSFSLTAPTSNSSGAFSYTSDNSGVAAVIVPTPVLYSITSPANRTLSLTNFPILGAMPTWEMNIRFTTGATGSNSWRPLIGDMYNAVNGGRGWGVWVSSSNGIHFSWISNTWDAPGVSVALSTEYILKLTRTPTSLTVLLTTVSSGATQTATNTAMSNTSAYVMSVNGPVSIGGWANSGELFVGTMAYVNVINPNSSVVTNTTSNLLARYDASVAASGYTLSGSNVTQWNDLTGNGYHLIPNGTGPTTTTMNSVAALNFNSGLGLIRTSVPLSTSVTVFMSITYRSSLINDGGNFMHHGTSNELSLERYFNTSQIQFQTDSQHPAPTIITVANNTNYILVGRLNGTSREFWTYSDTVAPVYITGSSSALVAGNKTLYVGKSDGNEACNSSIGEIIYYNASLSNADVSANILYLQNKWLYSRYVAWSPSTNPYVSIVSNGTANITATQVASGNYLARSVSSLLTVGLSPTFGTFTLGPKSGAYMLADVSFSLTAPTSDSSGAFRYASDNSAVAVISFANTTSNLLARYDASVASGYTLSGSNVTQWNDLTGNGYHLTPNGTGPTLTTINSVPAFNFNSGLGLIRGSVPLTSLVTVFIVARYSTNIAGYGSFMHHGNRDMDWAIERDAASSNVQFQSDNNANVVLSAANNTNYIWIGRIVGNTREFWRYSDTVSTGFVSGTPLTITPGNKTLYVGKSDAGEACNSSIGEILYYNASLSNADVSANLLYLQNKWFNGLSATGPGVRLVGSGTANITATQDVCGNYMSKSVSSLLTVGQLPTFGTFTLGPNSGVYALADASFSLTAPTSDSSGAFSYTSDNSAVAIIPPSRIIQSFSATSTWVVPAGVTSVSALIVGGGGGGGRDVGGGGGAGGVIINTNIAVTPGVSMNIVVGSGGNPPANSGLVASNGGNSSFAGLVAIGGGGGGSLSNTAGANGGSAGGRGGTQANQPGTATTTPLQGNNGGGTSAFVGAGGGGGASQVGGVSLGSNLGGKGGDGIANSITTSTVYYGGGGGGGGHGGIGGSGGIGGGGKGADNGAQSASAGTDGLGGGGGGGGGTVTAGPGARGGSGIVIISYTTIPQVILVSNGTANITATQDACGNYMSKSVSSLLTVSTGVTPTLGTFTVPSTKVYGDASFNISLRPTSDSSGAITYSSSNTGVATIDASGNWITIQGAGDVSFNAIQAALGGFSSAVKTSNTLTVSKATPVYQPISQVTKLIGTDVSFSLTAIMAGVSTSNGAYTFSSGATSTTILSTDNMNNVSGGNFTAEKQLQTNLVTAWGVDLAGWTEAGNGTVHLVDIANTTRGINTPNYVIMMYFDNVITQTTAVSNSNAANAIYTVSFKAGPAVYYYSNQATQAASTDGLVFEILRGNNTVLATNTYLPGAWAGIINLTSSSFTYTGDGTGDIRVRIKTVSPNLTRFGGMVDDVVISSGRAYISISGDVATILEYTPSPITIDVSQAVTTNYNAGNTTFSLLIARGTPSYQAISQVTKTVGVDASFSLSAIMAGVSTSNGSYTFSSASDAISISGGIATINAYTPSAVTVTASQAVTAQYNVGSTTFSLLISRRTPSLSSATFTVPSSKAYGDASFSVFTRPISDSSGAITYTSSNTSVATIDASGNFITIVGVGDVSFNAAQAETSLFNAATRTSNTLTVSKATISLAFVNPPTTKNVTDAAFTVTATGARPDAVTYSSSDLARATVNSSTGLVTLKGAGTVIITASQASTEFYNASTATCSIVIAPAGAALQGQTVSSNASFASVDLSGASLVGTTVSGVSFSSANLSNVDFSGAVITGTNFSNANISGARNLPAFSTVQKLQLLKNINNAGVGAVQFNAPISGADISSLLATPNNEVAAATFTVKAPTAVDASANKIVTVSSEDIAGNKSVYIPINENETVKLNNIVYSFNGTNLLDASGNVVTFLITQNTPFKIYAGSIVALNIQNTLNRITILGDGLYNILHEILQPKAV